MTSIVTHFLGMTMRISVIVMIPGLAMAQLDTPAPAPAKGAAKPATTKPAGSKLNTNIYEQSDDQRAFTDTVKIVRDLDGNSEVMFMKQGGVYGAPNDVSAMARIVESQTSKSPVRITVDGETRKILNVTALPKPAPATGN